MTIFTCPRTNPPLIYGDGLGVVLYVLCIISIDHRDEHIWTMAFETGICRQQNFSLSNLLMAACDSPPKRTSLCFLPKEPLPFEPEWEGMLEIRDGGPELQDVSF
jgi:hypothetical protein